MSRTTRTRLTVNPEYAPLEAFVSSLPVRFRQGEGEIIHDGRNQLRRMQADGMTVVVKSFHRPNVINRLVYGRIRPSKAERSYRNALMLKQIGVGTPDPIAYLECYDGLAFGESYYVSLASVCPHVYQELFERRFDEEEDVLTAVGEVTARLHESGLAHKDYGRGNILFGQEDDGIRIELVDLNRMHRGRISMKDGCRNLERLPVTPAMRHALATAYARSRGFDAVECERLMARYRSNQPGKIDDKY